MYRNRQSGGFTLVELLVVIGMIVVLMGILLPVLGKVRMKAYEASTNAQLNGLMAQITAYHADFNAYPGPLSYKNVYYHSSAPGGAAPSPMITAAPMSESFMPNSPGGVDRVTMAENLVLGLLGGLRNVGTGAMPSIQYNTDWVGSGPGMLGATPKKLPTYGDATDLSSGIGPGGFRTGDYVDSNLVTGNDSIVPEYIDRFPDAMPILYLRARSGLRPVASPTAQNNAVATQGGSRNGQYDLSQVQAYTAPGDDGQSIGAGKDLDATAYVSVMAGTHGLKSVTYPATTDPNGPSLMPMRPYNYPFDLFAAMRHPTLDDSFEMTPKTPTPKQQDRFILISAGADRVYGTRDDITNFGAY